MAEVFNVRDMLALVVTFLAIQGLVTANGVLQKKGLLPAYVTRKVIHLFAAPVFLLCWLLYANTVASRYWAALVPLAFIAQFALIGTGIRKDDKFVQSMSRTGDPKELLGGTMHYAIAMLVTTLLFFDNGSGQEFNPAAILILGSLAGGDGLADIVGRRFGGKRRFGFSGAKKTPIGSCAMFIGSVVMVLGLGAAFSTVGAFSLRWLAVPAVVVSLVAMVVEAATPKGLDNYTIPVGALIGTVYLSGSSAWYSGPWITL
jgi:phytol kinase